MKPELTSVSLDLVLTKCQLPVTNTEIKVSGITHDHRKVQPGFIFVAIAGFNRHGIEFAGEAIAHGAVAVLTDSVGKKLAPTSIPIVESDEVRHHMAILAREIYLNSQSKLISIGVTGTNGKTTTTNLISSGLRHLEQNPLLIGTLGISMGDEYFSSNRTTPESTDLHATLLYGNQKGARTLVMEVSAHALSLGRVDGVKYDVAVFTGLSQDHLDFYADMNEYFSAKAELFKKDRAEFAVICIDDAWGLELAQTCQIPFVTYGVSNPTAQWRAKKIEVLSDGKTKFVAEYLGTEVNVILAIPGDFNVANALAALACASQLKLDLHRFAETFSDIKVPGRLERVESGQDFVALVDYAHTPDAVERAIKVARTCTTGRVITVVGCGGDRDPHKRIPMGANASQFSDVVIITDDNPRTEDPVTIRAEVLIGAAQFAAEVHEIGNRLEAIHEAVKLANPGDCVIVLGKGHESGQEINGVVTPFDDRLVLAEAIRARMT